MFTARNQTLERARAARKRARILQQAQVRNIETRNARHAQISESRRKYRERIGLPSAVDVWLASKLGRVYPDAHSSPLLDDEVQCSVYVSHIPVPDPAGFFVDLDTFILHMTVKTAPRSPDESPLESERCIMLGQYQGHPRDWSAPDWMKLHGQGTKVFRDSVEAVVNLMQCPAPLGPEQTTVSTQSLSVRVPWLIGALTRLVQALENAFAAVQLGD
ncbi:hypothetical protein C2E23DRAFT_732292 [Lenzites betulinus]|nr:hypothetical protein C2E23DRAFT_732292 [Lenzites betulinus]